MMILSGLFPHMVMRRDSSGVSTQTVTGATRASGGVRVTVTGADGAKIRTDDLCGAAANGVFSATLDGIPAGGPYRVTLAAGKEKITVEDVLVGDVWISAGQSNMQGCGNLSHACQSVSPLIRAFYMNDQWGAAKDPVTQMILSSEPVHRTLMGRSGPAPARYTDPRGKGAGPCVSFLNEMFRRTGIPQGVIACAHGGTSMSQWAPSGKSLGGASLYGAMMKRFLRNGGLVSGMIWYQGCNDANPADAPLFLKRLEKFFQAVRRDFAFPEMPIVQVQLSRLVYHAESGAECWTAVREAQRVLPHRMPNLFTIAAIDLELDDGIHLSGKSQTVLGKRLADAMLTLLGEKDSLPPPPDLASVSFFRDSKTGDRLAKVRFRNLVGGLKSEGRPNGFSFGEKYLDHAFRVDLSGDTAILSSGGTIESVGYGCGWNPFCNLSDEAGRPVPAFAPVIHRSVASFAKHVQVSGPIFGDGDVSVVSAASASGLEFKNAECSIPEYAFFPDRETFVGRTGIRFFRTHYKVSERIPVTFKFGYDGPVRLFLDGKSVFTDPNGTNPVVPESHTLCFTLEPGGHEVLFAISMRKGETWGISLCMKSAKKNTVEEVE